MRLNIIAFAILATSTSALAVPSSLKYQATILTYACTSENNGHRCERLPSEPTEIIELSPSGAVSSWQKWVRAKKFLKTFDFNLDLSLRKNSNGTTYTLSSKIANPWEGTFDLGQTRMKLDSLEGAPKEWMIGSTEVSVEPGQSYSVRLILKAVP